jgi:autotransporter-associated beta strand protein
MNDLLDGGDGYDTLRGDAGNDHLWGGAQPDRLRGSAGNDDLHGGGGRDLMAGEAGDDVVMGDAGDDVVTGGDGHNTLRGGSGHDAIYTGDNDDVDASEVEQGEMAATAATVNAGGLTIDSGGTLQKTGSGTLTLSGGNSYSGNVSVAAGTLTLNTDTTLSGDITLTAGSTLSFATPSDTIMAGALHAADGAHIAFDLGVAGQASLLKLTKPGGLDAHGVVIDLKPQTNFAAGTYTLIQYSGTPAAGEFTLGGGTDAAHRFRFVRDDAAGTIKLVVTEKA